jgi:hypothetical protein
MKAFPNPATDVLSITGLNADEAAATVVIMDVAGRVASIVASNGQTTQQLDVATLPQGVYFIELHDNQDQVIGRTRFVKQ